MLKCSMCEHCRKKIVDDNIWNVKERFDYCDIPLDYSYTDVKERERILTLNYRIIDNHDYPPPECPLLKKG